MVESQKELKRLKEEFEARSKEFETREEEYKLAKERAEESEKLLHELVETAVGDIGQDFFNNIVIKLSEWLGAEIVLIGQMIEPNRITALPLYSDGEISHGFSYELSGSPCDITTRKGYCSYSDNVIDLFPKDKLLVDMKAVGYIGTALYNKEGEANGVICAVSRGMLKVPPMAKDILGILGARVSAEIERKKIEEALKRSENELRESNATKDKFFSIIAHDLKGPFQTILGFSELLLNRYYDYSDEKRIKFIELIHQSGFKTHSLLENLLAWSRSQRGMIQYTPENIHLYSFMKKDVNLFRKLASEKSININVNIPDNINILADMDMLSTIIRNLLSNAVKFTNEGGEINVYAKLNENNSADKEVSIFVEDNGIGIDKSRLNSIFDVNENISTPGTHTEQGTGLGLLLCKEFIEKHQGSIYVESEPGVGSKFIIKLKSD